MKVVDVREEKKLECRKKIGATLWRLQYSRTIEVSKSYGALPRYDRGFVSTTLLSTVFLSTRFT